MSEAPHVRRARHEAMAIAYAQIAAEFARRYAPLSESDELFHGWLIAEAYRHEARAEELTR